MRPLCPSCRQAIDETDCYCRYCGHTLQPRMGFWYSHGGILLVTLLAGPLSLIFVWMSRKISTPAKWIWTAGILATSFYFCYSLYKTILMLQSAFSATF